MESAGKRDYSIEPMTDGTWEAVRAVYLGGIATGNTTFETKTPGRAAWDNNHRKDRRWW